MRFHSTGWARRHYHRWGLIIWERVNGQDRKQQYCNGCGAARYPK